jgi:hypothetical protein
MPITVKVSLLVEPKAIQMSGRLVPSLSWDELVDYIQPVMNGDGR